MKSNAYKKAMMVIALMAALISSCTVVVRDHDHPRRHWHYHHRGEHTEVIINR